MESAYVLADCPECRAIRTVIMDVCYVCFAEFGERVAEDVDGNTADVLAWPASKGGGPFLQRHVLGSRPGSAPI